MKFVVYDDEGDDAPPTELGWVETDLATIMAAKNQELKKKLMSGDPPIILEKTKLTIKAESVGDSNNEIEFEVKCVIPYMRKCFNLCKSADIPYLIIERSRNMEEIMEKNKDIVLNKKTKETEPRNFDPPPEII